LYFNQSPEIGQRRGNLLKINEGTQNKNKVGKTLVVQERSFKLGETGAAISSKPRCAITRQFCQRTFEISIRSHVFKKTG